jgi:peroxiredoxin
MKKLLFALFALLVFNACVRAQPPLGAFSPDIILPAPTGEVLKLSSLKGKVVLLDFWASWCQPCRHSNRQLQSLYKEYNAKGFEIFGVSLDQNKDAWKRAIKQDNISWPQVIDARAVNGSSLAQTWRLQYIPTTFLINKEGKIVAVNPEKKELEKLLPQLL